MAVFPPRFVWGAAAASYQIEGATDADGKGPSVWDVFCRQPGRIWQGNSGEVACDHYHRYRDDVRLMKELGLQAYRFSISWPRVLPQGVGARNERGLAFYDRLVDLLLEHDIQPWVTLFHWDYPHELFRRGGWLHRDSSNWFAEYSQVVVDRLSDRVAMWMTQNEPQCYIGLGHLTGEHAPGLRLALADVLQAAHNSLLAHGKAVQVIRSRAKRKPGVGASLVGVIRIPATEAPEDVAAAREATFAVRERNCANNTWFADPMLVGRYPEDGLRLFADALPEIGPEDMDTICQPLDFYGVNIYFGEQVRARGEGEWERLPPPAGAPLTTMEWPVTPDALYWGPRFLYERYGLPIAVTENGMANCDWVSSDGRVHDPQRIDFLTRYLLAYARAIAEGVPGIAYFVWSIMDNFEWAHGYKQRFGLVYVDYQTQARVVKDSGYWYRGVIASSGKTLGVRGQVA
ncbi:MAG: GH1 family beta-glucosidase [Candidatus Oleimicrobiaceae bacterium]